MTTDIETLRKLVSVKPLEWEDFDGQGAKATAMLLCSYIIMMWYDDRFEISVSAPGYAAGFDGERFHPTLEAAKAAAQADYERRILSALTPSPEAQAEPVVPKDNDAIWAAFYRDGLTLEQVAEKFGLSAYDLSPWLYRPLMRMPEPSAPQPEALAAQEQRYVINLHVPVGFSVDAAETASALWHQFDEQLSAIQVDQEQLKVLREALEIVAEGHPNDYTDNCNIAQTALDKCAALASTKGGDA